MSRRTVRARGRVAAVLCVGLGLAGALVSGPSAQAAATAWSVVPSPLSTGQDAPSLNSVSCPSANTCFAVGESAPPLGGVARTLIESWNGRVWSIIPSPDADSTSNVLNGVSCTSPTYCLAVGGYGTTLVHRTLVERWNGVTWAIVPSPRVGLDDYDLFNAVSCSAPDACGAVGLAESRSLFERWDGRSWTVEPAHDPASHTTNFLRGVACTSATACTAVGAFMTDGPGDYPLLVTWNGRTVTQVGLPSGTSLNGVLQGVSCSGSGFCVAGGFTSTAVFTSYRALIATWNGARWTLIQRPELGGNLNAVSCATPVACTAVGTYAPQTYTQPLVLGLAAGSWALEPSPGTATILSGYAAGLSCATAQSCTLVGWQELTSPQSLVESTGPPRSTVTGLLASLDPAPVGTPVTFSARVSSIPPGWPAVGRLEFLDDGVPMTACGGAAGVALTALGEATCTTTFAVGGARHISAAYLGSNELLGSTSPMLDETVPLAPSFTSLPYARYVSGLAQTFTVASAGDPTPTLTESGALPAGVTFHDAQDGTATFAGTATALGDYPVTLTSHNGVGVDAAQAFVLSVKAPAKYVVITRCRLYDSRTGTGSCSGVTPASPSRLGPGAVRAIQVAGVSGVPADAEAVVLNLAASGASAPTYLAAYPDGTPRPLVSNVNVSSTAAVSNLDIVPIGSDGKIDVYNGAGSVNAIVDLAGYFEGGTGDGFTPLTPCRLFDTRTQNTTHCAGGTASTGTRLAPGGTLQVRVTAATGVPASATVAAISLTAVGAASPTYLTAFPAGPNHPDISDLNVSVGRVASHLVLVPIGANGVIDVYNGGGAVDVVGDLVGFFGPTGTSAYAATTPCRLLDTRTVFVTCPGAGPTVAQRWLAGSGAEIFVAGVNQMPASTTGLMLDVTAVDATGPTFVTAYPSGPRPPVSTVNVSGPGAVAAAASVGTGIEGAVDIVNSVASVDVIADLEGFYFAP
jgi:hypothetical protein